MNYRQWNNAIVRHFFNEEKEEKEVILYFSETIIKEIGRDCFVEPEEGYVNDFYKALRTGVPGINSENFIHRIIDINNQYITCGNYIEGEHYEYPPVLSYLLTFILPFTSGEAIDEFSMSNFHDIARVFFEKNGFTDDYGKKIKGKLKDIDFLWDDLYSWLLDEKNLSLGYIEMIDPPAQRRFVRKFEYHILFRKEQEEKLTQVFDKENILPNNDYDKGSIKSLLIRYKNLLRLSQTTVNKIKTGDYIGDKIVSRAKKFYKNWDGTEFIDINGTRGYSRTNLILSLSFNSLTNEIDFKHLRIFQPLTREYPEKLVLKHPGEDINNVCREYKEYSTPITNIFKDLETPIELICEANRNKYNWKTNEFYIFKRMQIGLFEWLQIPKVEFNAGRTLIICNKEFETKNKLWIDSFADNCTTIGKSDGFNLDDNWTAILVKNITDNPHQTISALQPESEEPPRISFDKSFYKAGCLYKDKLPEVWIENAEVDQGIVAQYVDESVIPLEQQEIETEEGIEEKINLFHFTDDHRRKSDQEFKLVSGTIRTHRLLRIVDFDKIENVRIEKLLPKRDSIGQETTSPLNFVKGLEHFNTPEKTSVLLPYQNQLNRPGIFQNVSDADNYSQNNTYDRTHKGNMLLHYISSKGKLSKSEFDEAVYSLVGFSDEEKNIKERSNYLRYQLQDAGFIDYDASNSIILINKSHLVIKPTKKGTTTLMAGARDSKLAEEIIEYCQPLNNIVIETQDDRDLLFPQIFYVKFKTSSHSTISEFAERFDLLFKKDGLYTQFALASHFGDISDWNKHIFPVENELEDFPGGEVFDLIKLRFIPKPGTFNKMLSLVKFSNINGYKTVYRLWYKEEAYKITNQQYGIYLFLYLYRIYKNEIYENCKEEKGWVNCREEIDDYELAQKLSSVILYDPERQYLAVPVHCRLPGFLSISIALLNGKKTETEYLDLPNVRYKGYYLVYKNIPRLFVMNTIDLKLKQRIIELEIII